MRRLKTAAGCGPKDAWRDVFGDTFDECLFRLKEQPFPYQVPTGTVHLVAWFSNGPWAEANIALSIERAIDELGGGDFVYYTNPKKSVVDDRLEHVQVFWCPLSRPQE